MTSLGKALRNRLIADAAVSAIVADRVHWVKRDQGGSLPAIVMTRVSHEEPEHLDGLDDMQLSRIQIDCLAESHAQAWALADAAKAALRDEAQVDDMVFWRASFSGPRDLGEQSETKFVHRASMDMMCRHTASE